MPAGNPQGYQDIERAVLLQNLLGQQAGPLGPGLAGFMSGVAAETPGIQSARVKASQTGDIATVRMLEALLGNTLGQGIPQQQLQAPPEPESESNFVQRMIGIAPLVERGYK